MDSNRIYIISAKELEKLQEKLFGAYLEIAESLEKDYFSIDLTREVKGLAPKKVLMPRGIDPLF